MLHELKSWPEFYGAMVRGEKPFDLRYDDRPGGFNVGDQLLQKEWNPDMEAFTGRSQLFNVTYVVRAAAHSAVRRGLEQGYVIMGISPIRW